MLASFVLILSLLILSDVAVTMAGLPVPGAVVGLALLGAIFALRGGTTLASGRMFDAIIPYAPMLFVPAGVGVVANLDLIASAWLPIVVAITLGTAITLVVTGLVAQMLLRLRSRTSVP